MKKLITLLASALLYTVSFAQCSPTPYGDYLTSGTKYRIVTVDSLEYAVVMDIAGHSDFTDLLVTDAQIAVLHTDSATITSTIINGSWVQNSTFSASSVTAVCSQNSTPKYALTLFTETSLNGFGMGNCTSGCVDTMFYIHVSSYVGTGEIRLHNGTTIANSSGTLDECLWAAGVTNAASVDPDNNSGSKPLCGHYIYGGTNAEPLPVTLIDFNGDWVGNNATLTWSTASELNNQGFAVQRSFDGVTWTSIDFVPTQAEGGNSVNMLKYQYSDQGVKTVVESVVYYRLVQFDWNNESTEIPPVALNVDRFVDEPQIYVFPNPVSKGSDLHVKLNTAKASQSEVKLVDQLGKIYYEHSGTLTPEDEELLITIDLAPGMYYLELVLNDQIYSLPVFIDK